MGFEMAMDVKTSDDCDRLAAAGWRVVDPLEVSSDPSQYREYVRMSRGEFSVAKDMNVRLRSGWFSDRSACYLAAGRPVVLQDTGFGDVVSLGPGLHAFQTVEGAVRAIREIEADWPRPARMQRRWRASGSMPSGSSARCSGRSVRDIRGPPLLVPGLRGSGGPEEPSSTWPARALATTARMRSDGRARSMRSTSRIASTLATTYVDVGGPHREPHRVLREVPGRPRGGHRTASRWPG